MRACRILRTFNGHERPKECATDAELAELTMVMGPFSTRRKLVRRPILVRTTLLLLLVMVNIVTVPDGAFVRESVKLLSTRPL